jgi:hypothetical protein
MKKFVIKTPKAGRSTVELITHRYLSKEAAKAQSLYRGTQTIYLGSFSIDLDPGRLGEVQVVCAGDASSGISLRPGVMVDGQPFELDAGDVNEIRDWLLQHGGHVRQQQRVAQLRAEREETLATLRQQLECEIRAELRQSLRTELLSELRPSAAVPALQAAEEALQAAAVALVAEVERLRADGARVSPRRTKSAVDRDPAVDTLRKATERLRRDAFSEFENACQTAGLMARRAPSSAK